MIMYNSVKPHFSGEYTIHIPVKKNGCLTTKVNTELSSFIEVKLSGNKKRLLAYRCVALKKHIENKHK